MSAASAATAKATKAAEATKRCTAAAKEVAEDIAKHAEDVVGGHVLIVAACTTYSGKAELVIALTFLGVVEDIVCLGSLLELLFSFLLLGITLTSLAVGVILDGALLVCALYLCIAGCLADTQHFVVISLLHIV